MADRPPHICVLCGQAADGRDRWHRLAALDEDGAVCAGCQWGVEHPGEAVRRLRAEAAR